jgi:hypothetical protein
MLNGRDVVLGNGTGIGNELRIIAIVVACMRQVH